MAAEYNAEHLSTDEFGTREVCRRFERALDEQRSVIVDSTGMSWRIRDVLHVHRSEILHVHLLLADEALFAQREAARTDRPHAPVPLAAFRRSKRVEFADAPDLILETDDRTMDQVYEIASYALKLKIGCG